MRGRFLVLMISLAVTGIFISLTLSPKARAANASDWRAGSIISDSIFTDSNSMSVQQIQAFLDNLVPSCDTWGTQPATEWGRPDLTHAQFAALQGWPGPPYVCLNEYVEVPKTSPGAGMPDNSYNHYDAGSKQLLSVPGGASAAQLIYNAAQQYGINPEVLLVTIQKESAGPLTTDTWPLESQYTYALGAHCPDSTGCDPNYAGFSIQISESAALFRYYLDNMTQPWWPYKTLGDNSVLYNPNTGCGASTVNITTSATAALYTYTPYQPDQAALNNLYGTGDSCSAYGNRNFWRNFTDWFGSTVVPQSSEYIPPGTYVLRNPYSGKVLDVSGGSTNDGATAQIYSQNGTPAQEWHIAKDVNGYYTFTNVGSGKSLDVMGGSATSGTRVQIWDTNGGCSQEWSAIIVQGGLTFLNACSGLALDILGGNTNNATPTQIYSPNGSGAQTWALQLVDPAPIANGFYQLNTTSGLSLEANGNVDGSNAQIDNPAADGTQYWEVVRLADGFYNLINPKSGKYLDVTSEGRTAGTNVQIWDGDSTCAQEWQFALNSDSTYSLFSACSGLALDVADGATSTDGANVQIYTPNGTPAQEWTLAPLPQIPNSIYNIATPAGKVLDVTGGSTSNGARIQLWNNNGTPAQLWNVTYQGNGLYSLQNLNSGKFLDLAGASTAPGAAVQIYTGNGTCAQLWQIINNGNSTYRLLSSCTTNNVVDATGGAIDIAGTKVQSYTQNGSVAQMWTFDAP